MRRIEVNDEHSAIIESKSSNSSSETTAFTYMEGTPDEVARQFKEQARVQMEQLEMIRAQQAHLLKEKKKPKGRTPSKKSKAKWKEGESPSSANTENEEHSNSWASQIFIWRGG